MVFDWHDGSRIVIGHLDIFGESSYWLNVAHFHYMQGYLVLSLKLEWYIFH